MIKLINDFLNNVKSYEELKKDREIILGEQEVVNRKLSIVDLKIKVHEDINELKSNGVKI